MVSVSVLLLVSNYTRCYLPGCILYTARCSLTFQDQEVPVSSLVMPLRQSNMPHVTREQLWRFLLFPEVTIQRWNLICANGPFPYASSPTVFFISDKLQTGDFPQISILILILCFVNKPALLQILLQSLQRCFCSHTESLTSWSPDAENINTLTC